MLICVDKAEAAVRIAENMKAEFPLVPVLARAYDRGAAIGLINVGVDYQIRETFESALLFGGATLEKLGVDQAEVAEVIEDVRRRDAERLESAGIRRPPGRPPPDEGQHTGAGADAADAAEASRPGDERRRRRRSRFAPLDQFSDHGIAELI